MQIEKTGFASADKPWLSHYCSSEPVNHERWKGRTVWDVTEEMLEKYSDVPMIEYFGNTISRSKFRQRVIEWAKAFRALGIKEDDIIPVYSPLTPETYMIFFAANLIGAAPYYLKIDLTNSAIETELEDAKIAIVCDAIWDNAKDVFESDNFEKVIIISVADSMKFPAKQILKLKSRFDKTNTVPSGRNVSQKYLTTKDILKLGNTFTGEYKAEYKPQRIATVTSSSGTTSHVAKGIMDTNESILAAMACSFESQLGFSKGSRMFTCFPLLASTSLNCEHLLPTLLGGTIVQDPRADTSLWFKQLITAKPDAAVTTGPVWEQFANDVLEYEKKTGRKMDLSWIDYFIMGGSGTTPEILDWTNTVLMDRGAKREIKVGYGMSEVFGVITVNTYEKNAKPIKTPDVIDVGIPLNGYIASVFDSSGNELPYGQGKRGELWVKAPANMEGYYKKPTLTSETLVDGWVHTGDMCEMDEYGNIYCYGRLTNYIEINGRDIYLFDIANKLREEFELHDCLAEKKKLSDGTLAINVYFVQKESIRKSFEEIVANMSDSLLKDEIKVNGFKEFIGSHPVDPATIKQRTKDTEGFRTVVDGDIFEVSYKEVAADIYEETTAKSNDM